MPQQGGRNGREALAVRDRLGVRLTVGDSDAVGDTVAAAACSTGVGTGDRVSDAVPLALRRHTCCRLQQPETLPSPHPTPPLVPPRPMAACTTRRQPGGRLWGGGG